MSVYYLVNITAKFAMNTTHQVGYNENHNALVHCVKRVQPEREWHIVVGGL